VSRTKEGSWGRRQGTHRDGCLSEPTQAKLTGDRTTRDGHGDWGSDSAAKTVDEGHAWTGARTLRRWNQVMVERASRRDSEDEERSGQSEEWRKDSKGRRRANGNENRGGLSGVDASPPSEKIARECGRTRIKTTRVHAVCDLQDV
jgi:hypothetical protein